MNKESYTIYELAVAWEVNPITVWRRIKERKLKAFRVGRSWRIKMSEKTRYEEATQSAVVDSK